MLKRFSIKGLIVILTSFFLLAFFVRGMFPLSFIKEIITEERKKMLLQLTNLEESVLNKYAKMVKAGAISKDEALKKAAEEIFSLHYQGGLNYLSFELSFEQEDEFSDVTVGVLQKMLEKISNVSGVIAEISHKVAGYREGIKQINSALTQMSAATENNAALVEELSVASDSLAQIANTLKQKIAEFKV